jgi:hypothetical protein
MEIHSAFLVNGAAVLARSKATTIAKITCIDMTEWFIAKSRDYVALWLMEASGLPSAQLT